MVSDGPVSVKLGLMHHQRRCIDERWAPVGPRCAELHLQLLSRITFTLIIMTFAAVASTAKTLKSQNPNLLFLNKITPCPKPHLPFKTSFAKSSHVQNPFSSSSQNQPTSKHPHLHKSENHPHLLFIQTPPKSPLFQKITPHLNTPSPLC